MSNKILPRPRRTAGVREANTLAVLDIFRAQRQTTRTELQRLAGLSKGTISEIVDDLLGQGLVQEVGKYQEGRGRSRVLLAFDPRACLVLGAQIQDEACDAVLADLDARPLRRVSRPISGTDPEVLLGAVQDAVAELSEAAAAPILGLGLGAPGSVDPGGRRVTISVSHGWRDLPVADLLESRLGLPVVAANRAKVAALGEIWHGHGKGVANLVYVFMGTGLVAGIVIDGMLFFGSDGGAGEIGHLTVEPDGPICGCGNRGCLHTIASEGAILRLARAKAREADPPSSLSEMADGALGRLKFDQLLDAVGRRDAAALSTVQEVGQSLGIVVANLVNTLNPEMVIVGGPTARLGDALLEPLRTEVRRRALGDLVARLQIHMTSLDEDAGAIGAAALFLERSQPLAVRPREVAHA